MNIEPGSINADACFPLLQTEAARLQALHALGLLDTPPEERFDRITRLACRLLDMPISLIALVDHERQWFKSRAGLDLAETSRADSFCTYTIQDEHGLVVPDTLLDPRFRDNPFVKGAPNVRFYAGIPLAAPDGSRVGALCVIDSAVRRLDESQMRSLRDLAAIAGEEVRAGAVGRPLHGPAGAMPSGWERVLVTNLADGVLMLDGDGVIVAANRSAEMIFGGAPGQLTGRIARELLDEDLRRLRLVGGLPEGVPYESRARRIDGAPFPIELTYCALLWEGRPMYAATVRDISARRAAEERGRALETRRRHHFATATHELRTPMSSVLGFSELLLKRDFDPATSRELVEIIHRETGRLVDLVNQLLDLARIEAGGKDELKIRPVALPKLVAQTLSSIEGLGQAHRVSVELADGLPPLAADATKLQQALTNILSNSIKYSAPDTPIVLQAALEFTNAQPEVTIRVRDRGYGMTPAQQAQVFDAFYRVDRDSNVPGSGLGMTILKEIIDLHGGRIVVESAVGVGTEVILYLPPAMPN
ncbi:sensor histidine kinase [Massilia sp.]|uniref:sensor histidine kinase n=1 Tax=Massilia sp. TaxID=1882437 RepID=UPI00289CFCDE|nr:ATP-binding protein [Massilia sp.]